jgi:hypothetical protein
MGNGEESEEKKLFHQLEKAKKLLPKHFHGL